MRVSSRFDPDASSRRFLSASACWRLDSSSTTSFLRSRSEIRADRLGVLGVALELDPDEYNDLLTPILENKADVVYGSRFLSKKNKVPFLRRIANKSLTSFTNFLYRSHLTDMETAYKVFTSEVSNSLELRANRFDIEPEITAKICKAGYEIFEVPISYNPRTKSEGKKIKLRDGIKAIWMLIKCRFKG